MLWRYNFKDQMKLSMRKKLLFILFAGSFAVYQSVHAGSIEQYVQSVEAIKDTYRQETRAFFNGLDPYQKGFSQVQQEQFCGIVRKYVDGLYQAADENRAFLDKQYSGLIKQDVIQQVETSKEMQMLKKYNVKCDLK